MRAPAVPSRRRGMDAPGVAGGLADAENGRDLFIGKATVKTHLPRVIAKLGVDDDRTRAVMLAVERALLPGPGPGATVGRS
jgi:hypothetical protein